MRVGLLLMVAVASLVISATATAATRAERYVDRLAHNARQGDTWQNCVVLRSIDLCGWRVPQLVVKADRLTGQIDICWTRRFCSYEFTGVSRSGEAFFCTGTLVISPRRVRADQAADCYGERDPTWFVNPDDVLIRTPES